MSDASCPECHGTGRDYDASHGSSKVCTDCQGSGKVPDDALKAYRKQQENMLIGKTIVEVTCNDLLHPRLVTVTLSDGSSLRIKS